MIVRFVDVDGIVDNHCLSFLFNALSDNWHYFFLNIKFHYFTLFLNVMLDNLSCSLTSISFLTYTAAKHAPQGL